MNSLIEYRHRFKLGILTKYQNNKMSDHRLSLKRIRLNREELNQLSKEEIITRWLDQEAYIDSLEAKRKQAHGEQNEELIGLRESEEKLKQQQIEATRRENVLVMRLTTKEQEMQEYANQIQELKQAQNPTTLQLRSALLDPAVNLLFQRMKKEVDDFKEKVEQTQNELSAWKFTPDSNTGKRLMAKCRLLYQENEEFGKMISSGRLAKLEGDLALQKNFSEEMKKSQKELDELLLELDEEVEGMQSTIYFYQQQVKEIKDQLHKVQEENKRLHNQQSVVPHSIEEKFSWTHEHNKTSQSSGTTNGAHVNHHCLQKLSDLDLKVDRTSSVTSTSSPPRSRTCDLSPKSTLNENNCNHQTVCNNNLKLESTECSAISQQSDSWNTFKLKHLRSNVGEGDSQAAEKTDDNKIGESGQCVMTNGLVDSPACIDQEQT